MCSFFIHQYVTFPPTEGKNAIPFMVNRCRGRQRGPSLGCFRCLPPFLRLIVDQTGVAAIVYRLQKVLIYRSVLIKWLQSVVTSIPSLFWRCGEPVDDSSDVIEGGSSPGVMKVDSKVALIMSNGLLFSWKYYRSLRYPFRIMGWKKNILQIRLSVTSY